MLVNNAGITVVAPFDQFSRDDLDRMVAGNVRASFITGASLTIDGSFAA